MDKKTVRRNVQAAHRQTLLQRLQRRLEVARAQDNPELIRLLEAEAEYLNH